MRKIISLTTAILSLALVAMFIPVDNEPQYRQAFGTQVEQIQTTSSEQSLQGLDVELSIPQTI